MTEPQTTQTSFITFGETDNDAFLLESGERFGPVTLAYETYGELNAARDNAILVFHAFSGSQHAAGYNPSVPGAEEFWTEDCHLGWWDAFIGPGKALDTRLYHVICVNYLGGCYGSTGPASVDPATGKRYGGKFPTIAMGDIVNSQVRLLDRLGIQTLLAAVGGSLGGMMAMDLAIRYPDRVRCVIPIAAGLRVTTLQKLHNFEQIYAIEEDRNFNYGDYYEGDRPTMGLALARMIAAKTFVSLQVMEERARNEIVQEESDLKGYRIQHRMESYMLHQGKKFVDRFDANSYLRIVNMWQRFELAASGGGDPEKGRLEDPRHELRFDLAANTDDALAAAFGPCRHHRYLVFSIDSDVCYYTDEQSELCRALKAADINYQHITVHSDKGHDSFLLEPELYSPYLSFVLHDTHRTIGK